MGQPAKGDVRPGVVKSTTGRHPFVIYLRRVIGNPLLELAMAAMMAAFAIMDVVVEVREREAGQDGEGTAALAVLGLVWTARSGSALIDAARLLEEFGERRAPLHVRIFRRLHGTLHSAASEVVLGLMLVVVGAIETVDAVRAARVRWEMMLGVFGVLLVLRGVYEWARGELDWEHAHHLRLRVHRLCAWARHPSTGMLLGFLVLVVAVFDFVETVGEGHLEGAQVEEWLSVILLSLSSFLKASTEAFEGLEYVAESTGEDEG